MLRRFFHLFREKEVKKRKKEGGWGIELGAHRNVFHAIPLCVFLSPPRTCPGGKKRREKGEKRRRKKGRSEENQRGAGA